ncbi:hypothetical protein MNBD_IGNAVI01-210 [hydrothermal vent metagenome]|uniref:Uncharacterized protein n=1 Tax=hydrothermal vent metagenome TaxID=652676 RepID=A0A3B1CDY8_9ZZZZ
MILLVSLLQLLMMFTITSSNVKDIFPQIEGYQEMGELEIYNPDNLYDCIDGAADSYLKYDFEELQLMRYKGNKEQFLKIEVYKHADKDNAFGIYSNERPLEGNWVDVGAQGYYESKVLNFYKGKYYVKLMGFKIDNIEEFLLNIAREVADNLEGDNKLPKLLTLFPAEGKIENSGRFINKNFLGYESLTKVFTTEYNADSKSFKIFITQKNDVKSCRKMLEDYFVSIKNDTKNIKEGFIYVKDPYQGEYDILWQGNIVAGVIDSPDAELNKKYLEKISKNLK